MDWGDICFRNKMILAILATLAGYFGYYPLFADTGFSTETYRDPSLFINLAIFLPVIFVVFYFSFKNES